MIAFLGTGLLGSGFVQHLLATGPSVTIWNRTPDKAAPLVAAGARLAATPADAVAGAERIHLCLSSDDAVESVLAALLPGAAPEAVVIDHSTTSADGAASRAARLAAAGRAFLHAPVFMGPSHARDGKGIMMCSGPEAVFRGVEAGLAAMTGDLWYLGEDPRRAAGLKLIGNAMLISIAGAIADTLTLARGLGLPAADVHAVMDRLKPGGAINIRGRRMADGDFTASFELAMARKDVGLMLDAMGDLPVATLRSLADRADALIARGHGQDDLGVLALDAVR